jgi:hypothetical protein
MWGTGKGLESAFNHSALRVTGHSSAPEGETMKTILILLTLTASAAAADRCYTAEGKRVRCIDAPPSPPVDSTADTTNAGQAVWKRATGLSQELASFKRI